MRVGLDLDDLVTELPEFFSVLTHALVERGHEVHVITFREPGSEERVAAHLESHYIRYTEIHLPRGGERPQDWKGRLAKQLSLDVMIDDSPEVLEKMPVGVKRLWVCDPQVFDPGACLKALRES